MYAQGLTFIDFMEALGRLSDCITYPTKHYLNETLNIKTYAEYRKQLKAGVLVSGCPVRESRHWDALKTIPLSWKLECFLTDLKSFSLSKKGKKKKGGASTVVNKTKKNNNKTSETENTN